MAVIPYDVARSFIAGKPARRGNFYCTANECWSYGLLLAYKVHNDPYIHVRVREGSSTITTNRHIKALYTVLRQDSVAWVRDYDR